MNTILFVSGAITTVVFTLMMHCTRSESPTRYQATYYTVLSTAELLGKLLCAPIFGYTTEKTGYCVMYFVFVQLSILPIYFIWRFKCYLTYT